MVRFHLMFVVCVLVVESNTIRVPNWRTNRGEGDGLIKNPFTSPTLTDLEGFSSHHWLGPFVFECLPLCQHFTQPPCLPVKQYPCISDLMTARQFYFCKGSSLVIHRCVQNDQHHETNSECMVGLAPGVGALSPKLSIRSIQLGLIHPVKLVITSLL